MAKSLKSKKAAPAQSPAPKHLGSRNVGGPDKRQEAWRLMSTQPVLKLAEIAVKVGEPKPGNIALAVKYFRQHLAMLKGDAKARDAYLKALKA